MASRAGLAPLALLLACAAPPPTPPDPGAGSWVSAAPAPVRPGAGPVPGESAPPPEPTPTPWELAPELKSFVLVTPRARSQHFAGDLEAEVRVNPPASDYPRLGPSRRLPAGSALVETHYRPGSVEPVVLLAMVKRAPSYDPEAGDWEYLILTPSGEATYRGRLPLCRRCHAEAPHDHVFGGPR